MLRKNRSLLNGLIIILSFSIVIVGISTYLQQSEKNEQTEETATEPGNQNGSDKNDNSEEKPELPMWYTDGTFELPIVGAAGYTSVKQALYEEPDSNAGSLQELSPGTPFEIRGEVGGYWLVRSDTFEGWIEHRFAFINLPDVIPSIIYNHTNSYDSRFQSSRVEIPELTGEPLNPMIEYNDRLQKEEFIMPLLYQTAKKLFYAQQLALQNGESLVVYETFRPRDVQLLVNDSLTQLVEENEKVAEGIADEPWSMTWFINMNVSNHQRGIAIDLSLAEVEGIIDQTIGDYRTLTVENYTEYIMHTPLHELSAESAIFERPIASADREGWKDLTINSKMTEPSLKLQEYMVEAGFNPLASEWWHFNDVDALEDLEKEAGSGEFYIKETFNSVPLWKDLTLTKE
ncbi:SH3 domain-containing protein [Alkalibacterium sp. f15]|uniref:SH3 domain-containing protein n=1 Tax=Alkalibacterium sp. f15 TaxID=3414029 RepID=UPI003BF7BF46